METYLEDYNSTTVTPMKLVLFADAMEHVSRVCRIISQPLGNALLLGVGCSGRRSLARLAAYMCDYEVFQVDIRKGYGNNEWKEVSTLLVGCSGAGCDVWAQLTCGEGLCVPLLWQRASGRERPCSLILCAWCCFLLAGPEARPEESRHGGEGPGFLVQRHPDHA
jgi:hypothetical protein